MARENDGRGDHTVFDDHWGSEDSGRWTAAEPDVAKKKKAMDLSSSGDLH